VGIVPQVVSTLLIEVSEVSLAYLARRILFLLVVIWVASSITFFIPRISPKNPIRERFAELARTGGFSPQDLEKIVASYNAKFGLDKPVVEQYFDYMGGILRGDLGVSLNKFPKTVWELIMEALPWTIALLMTTTVLSFVIGNIVGAISAWPKSPRWVRSVSVPFILLQGVHPYLLGLLMIFFIAFRLKLLPLSGAYSVGTQPELSIKFLLDAARHQILPALSLILASVGGWALAMRGMGVTIQGEDYVNFAEHKGLKPNTIFGSYYVRNALLPQVTGLALAFGSVITAGILVETLYGLPGLGTVLGQAINANDFLVIYGIVLFIVIGVAIMMLVVDLVYPLLDPRIRYETK
jgi:peptide/nickel transport system permease protein